jgi:hypothetical protein
VKHPVLAAVGGFLVVCLIGFGSWAASVALSPLFGAGNAVKKVMDSDNMLGQYQHFLSLDKDIRSEAQNAQAAQKQLDDFNKQYPPSAAEAFQITQQRGNLQAQVSGPQQLCATNVAQYNNDAKAYTSTLFKDNRLPESFDVAVCTNPSLLPQGLQ